MAPRRGAAAGDSLSVLAAKAAEEQTGAELPGEDDAAAAAHSQTENDKHS